MADENNINQAAPPPATPNEPLENLENLPMLQDDHLEIIVKYHGDLTPIANDLGAEVEPLYQSYAIITIRRDLVPRLYTYSQIEHMELPKKLYFEDDHNMVSTCIQSVNRSGSYNLTGKGVIAAIIDTGIDYTHKDFQNADSTSRILYLWDQTAAGTPPAGFHSGAEFNNLQINLAINSVAPQKMVPSFDSNGHGTAVAGVMAGNGRESNGANMGVAPEADLVIVKIGTKGYESFARTTELMRAIRYVIDKAKLLNKPISINISFGTNNGSHRGDSLFETYITDIASEWKTVIVIPTGNEGAAGHHYNGRVQTNQTLEVEYFTAPGIESYYMTLWKNFVDDFGVEIIFPDGMSSGVVRIESQVKTVRQANLTLTIIYGQPNRYSYGQEIFFNFQSERGSILPGIWKLRVLAGTIVDGEFNVWLPTLEEVTDETAFSTPAVNNTLTLPSTAAKVVTVAGYNDRVGNIAEFSGRGNANTVLPNPDVAAPAVDIISTKSGGGYDTYTGTSIASPFVAGATVLMMQWGIVQKNDPFLYGERIKAFLRLGASRKQGVLYPNPSFGYGTLCLSKSMDFLTRYQLGGDRLWLQI